MRYNKRRMYTNNKNQSKYYWTACDELLIRFIEQQMNRRKNHLPKQLVFFFDSLNIFK